MGADDDPLDPVIQSILDGRPVDWTSAETQLPPCDRPLLEPLRIVATIAGQHPIQTVNTLGDESLDDRFALQELIGHGASGDVYRVWDTRLRREVAVKALRRDRPFAASVIAEARRIARVRHPGVVTIHDVYESATSAVICMELLRGRTLESLLTERGAFSVAEAAEIGDSCVKVLPLSIGRASCMGTSRHTTSCSNLTDASCSWTLARESTRRSNTHPPVKARRFTWPRKCLREIPRVQQATSTAWGCCSITWRRGRIRFPDEPLWKFAPHMH